VSVQVSVPAVISVHVSEEGDTADHVSEPADIGVQVSTLGVIGIHPKAAPIKELNGTSENALMPNKLFSFYYSYAGNVNTYKIASSLDNKMPSESSNSDMPSLISIINL
jgi:hypothetical protein